MIALRLSPEKINRITNVGRESGQATQTYLVGEDFLMRSKAALEGESTVLTKKVESEAARNVMQGREGTGAYRDYRGIPVYGAYADAGLNRIEGIGVDFKWAILGETDMREALAPARGLALRTVLIAVVLALAVLVAALLLAGGISEPVNSIAALAKEISKGNLTVDLPSVSGQDEIASLNKAFRVMLANLKNQVGKLTGGISVLSSAATEISSTVAQVSASISETSAAVAQTTATVEQVKQTAMMSGDRAKKVAKDAPEVVKISVSGQKATEDTIERMTLIKEQMQSIGETVVRLSDQSRAIEGIISTVKDLADQSNLLAVNASIEAARAGDQGKGFAVVANEIKALADQSKEATEQVRAILEETRKWISAVVMAAEQGGRAVELGMRKSAAARDAIEVLAASVASAAKAATLIGAASDQQSAGVEQVANAMSSIEQAMQQNMSGTVQLEQSAKRLEDLGLMLKEVVERYRV